MNRAQFNQFFFRNARSNRHVVGNYPAVQETSTDFVLPDASYHTMDADAIASEKESASQSYPVATSPYQQKQDRPVQHTLAPSGSTRTTTQTPTTTTTPTKPVASTATSSKTTTSGFGWGSFLLGLAVGAAGATTAIELSKKGDSQ